MQQFTKCNACGWVFPVEAGHNCLGSYEDGREPPLGVQTIQPYRAPYQWEDLPAQFVRGRPKWKHDGQPYIRGDVPFKYSEG